MDGKLIRDHIFSICLDISIVCGKGVVVKIFEYVQVSSTENKGTGSGYLHSSGCIDTCPNTCTTWKTFETSDDPWTEDVLLTIQCKGGYLSALIKTFSFFEGCYENTVRRIQYSFYQLIVSGVNGFLGPTATI